MDSKEIIKSNYFTVINKWKTNLNIL
jgi:hypothetical protein